MNMQQNLQNLIYASNKKQCTFNKSNDSHNIRYGPKTQKQLKEEREFREKGPRSPEAPAVVSNSSQLSF